MRLLDSELGLNANLWRLAIVNGVTSLLPHSVAPRLRAALYRLAGVRIGPRTLIAGRLMIMGSKESCGNLRIGSGCFINPPCTIALDAPVTLGDNVVIGYGVTIITGSHRMDDPLRRAGALCSKPVTIESGAWIAANVTILPGVTIGEGAVVGAASVVTQDVAPHAIYAGNPARFVRALAGGEAEPTSPGCGSPFRREETRACRS